jgi:RHS repeat-associated protein
VAVTGSNITTTCYYYLNGHRIALSVNQTVSSLGSDLLGSAEVALNTSGAATASVLHGPYGTARSTNGAMPTDEVLTGQHGDATTGLDDYGTRCYDPTIGQFASADSDAKGGLNRFAYVGGNPESRTDPTGHLIFCSGGCNPAPLYRRSQVAIHSEPGSIASRATADGGGVTVLLGDGLGWRAASVPTPVPPWWRLAKPGPAARQSTHGSAGFAYLQ